MHNRGKALCKAGEENTMILEQKLILPKHFHKDEAVCLGIDVGFGRMGVAILTSDGKVPLIDCIETSGINTFQERLYFIYKQLQMLVQLCNVVAYEEPILKGKNGAYLNQVIGAINIVAAENSIVPKKYTATAVKQSATGKGNADKKFVEKVLKERYSVESGLRDDSYDALAVALTYFIRENTSN